MAFWGTEVKPGKPFVHSTEKGRERLRISQATLGTGGSKEKSIVQCNVGKRSPVLLCVLLPNQTESCKLDIEFDEADDVLFSVIGPRSVYLTGYYVSKTRHYNPQSDTFPLLGHDRESYGVDIDNSPSEKSSYRSEDDKYDDSFINDGDDLQFRSPSPASSSKELDAPTTESDLKNRNGRGKRLRKKNQVVESDDENEDRNLISVFKSKKAANGNSKSAGVNNARASDITEKLKSKKNQVVEADDESEDEDEDGYLLSIFNSKKAANTKFAAAGENNAQTTDVKEKTEREKAEKTGKEREDTEKTFQVPSDGTDLGPGNCKKLKKRRNEHQLEGTFTEGPDMKCDEPPANEDKEQKTDNNVRTVSEPLENANQPKEKIKKKKTKKSRVGGDLQLDLPNKMDDYENSSMKVEDDTTNEKTVPKRTLPNGLIIEELAKGPPDGKIAALGKKVKIYYTAMLRENGHIFNSNIGKTALKFRLGDERIMEGLNHGIDGMHVGDKRRLIVPPSMGFGKHGAPQNVPKESWLVYDVELTGVTK